MYHESAASSPASRRRPDRRRRAAVWLQWKLALLISLYDAHLLRRLQIFIPAVRAVAVEALFNCINLLGFIKVGRNLPDPGVLISRECYISALESLMRAGRPGNIQLLTNVHASARAFQFAIIDRTAGVTLVESARKRAQELSQAFEVRFRTFGQKYFSRSDMQMLETTLNVAKHELD